MSQNNNKLPSNLPQLQNLIKRDPESYYEEFNRQYAVYSATKHIFEQNPAVYNHSLQELVMFFAQIAHCYSEDLKSFPEDLVNILQCHGPNLHPQMRLSFVKALVLVRNKNLLSPIALLSLFFRLLRVEDKNLRTFVKDHIVTDIKNINTKGKDMKLNRELQNFMFEMLQDNHAIAIKTSLDVMIELYKKRIWNDAKTVNIIASACFSKITKAMVAAIKFFIGTDEDGEDNGVNNDSDSDEDDDECSNMSLRKAQMATRVNKNKKRGQKKQEKVKKALNKLSKKKNQKACYDFSAIHLLHDPQTLAEKLYKKLEKLNERFEVKLMLMNLICRLVGIHELYVPNIYPFLQRYLFVKQRDVTKIMSYVAQSAHPLVPPDELEPVVRTLADNFVTERYSGEVMAMGLNAIRELCSRNPYCVNEDLLHDLVSYKSSKDKAVSLAARSLIALFRQKNPGLLARKHRTAPSELSKEMETKEFGQNDAKDFIPGAEVLTYNIEVDKKRPKDSESDSDGEWIDVSSEESDNNDTENDEQDEVSLDGSNQDDSVEEKQTVSKKDAIKMIMSLTPQERQQKAHEIFSSKILTDEDFAKIDAAQAAKMVQRYSAANKKRKIEAVDQVSKEQNEIVSLKSIEMVHKKRRHDKETRLQAILEGREGRPKFGSRKGRMNIYASTTNREKNKAKNYMMTKHKISRDKKALSFRDKQLKLKKGLLKAKIK